MLPAVSPDRKHRDRRRCAAGVALVLGLLGVLLGTWPRSRPRAPLRAEEIAPPVTAAARRAPARPTARPEVPTADAPGPAAPTADALSALGAVTGTGVVQCAVSAWFADGERLAGAHLRRPVVAGGVLWALVEAEHGATLVTPRVPVPSGPDPEGILLARWEEDQAEAVGRQVVLRWDRAAGTCAVEAPREVRFAVRAWDPDLLVVGLPCEVGEPDAEGWREAVAIDGVPCVLDAISTDPPPRHGRKTVDLPVSGARVVVEAEDTPPPERTMSIGERVERAVDARIESIAGADSDVERALALSGLSEPARAQLLDWQEADLAESDREAGLVREALEGH